MVSVSGDPELPYLVNKLAETFCKYMDGEENYEGSPCKACVDSAIKLAPTVEEELMRPADDEDVIEVLLHKGGTS